MDHALDTANMQSFIKILDVMAEKSQIFFTTFKTETLALRGMRIHNLVFDKSTHIIPVSYEQAEKVLQEIK